MFGDTMVKRRNRSSAKQGTGYSRAEERRPLMLPQELKELPNDEEIIFLEGCRPIKCRKNWVFKDRRLKKRLLPPVVVRPITLSGETPMPSKTLHAATIAASLALAACASPSVATTPVTKGLAASHSTPDVDVKAQHRAKDLFERLLTLIDQSKSIADLTPEHIGKVFGVHLRSYGPNDFGYSERISKTWVWNIDRVLAIGGELQSWDFGFRTNPKLSPPRTEICALDYDQFAARLKQMGFEGEPHYADEFGRVLYVQLGRDDLALRISYRGESNEAAGHRCVDLVQVL